MDIFTNFKRIGLGLPRLIIPAGILILCLLIPVGAKNLGWIPIIGWGENLVGSYCLENLQKAQSAYLATVTLDSAIALARSASASASLFGVGAELAPGEILSPAHDTIKTLSSYYYNAILMLMVERQGMGAISWLCFKLAIPIAMLCLLSSYFIDKASVPLKRAGFWLCKCALFIWLLLPLVSAISACADGIYFAPAHERYVKSVKNELGSIFGIPVEEAEKTNLANLSSMAWKKLSGAGSKTSMEKIKAILGNIKGWSLNTDNISGLLIIMFAQMAINVWIIPALVLLFLAGVIPFIFGWGNRAPRD